MTEDDQQHPKKPQVSRHVLAVDLVGDGRVDLYAGFCCSRRLREVPEEAEVVLRFDRPTATSLADLIYNIGEHQAAGMPIAQLSTDDSERLWRVLHDLWRALGVPLPYGDVHGEEPRRQL